MNTQIHRLEIKWSTSRGRDTYGYSLVRLTDSVTRKAYRTCGGGYDMVGTVFGNWLEDTYQAELRAIIGPRVGSEYSKEGGYKRLDGDGRTVRDASRFYGSALNTDTGKVSLDGACGMSTMQDIARAIGLEIEYSVDKRGNVTCYYAQMAQQVAA